MTGFESSAGIASPTGATLAVYTHAPASAPRAVVQVSHGLAEHAARYGRFAEALARQGMATVAHDHRGHGGTTAPDAPPRIFSTAGEGVGKVIADVAAVRDHIASVFPDAPVILFGHSMGGLIGLNVLMAHVERYAGAAIWNANFSAGIAGRLALGVLAWERFRHGSDVPSRVLPKLTFGAWAKGIENRRTEFDWLSRDPVEVDRYVADPLCGWDASVSMWRDVFGFVFGGADDGNLGRIRRDLPLFLAGGEHDPATDGGKAVAHLAGRMQRLGFSNLKSTIWPQTRHESLNEINRDMITAEFVAWAESKLGDLASA